ncbi:MAG: DUF362 domain-containing protein [Acidobacteriia bacterium]|nr:DUF362 domain-containing protein [Terriglobia bacterium]
MSCAHDRWTRRDAIVAGGMLLAQSCARLLPPERRVAIVPAPAYDQTLYDTVYRALRETAPLVQGRRIVLKPNLVEFDSASVINTHPMLVHAALEAFRKLGAGEVRIAEGPGHRRVTLDLADAAGYFGLIRDFETLFTDLNLDDVSEVKLSQPVSKLRSLYLPHTALGADLLVSMPKMKTHHWVGATLSMKNLFGVVPGGVYGWPKNVLHWAGINECIADLYRHFPRHFALVDAIDGMEGNGPIQGTTRHVGAIVAGQDLAAVDETCCRIMHIDPRRVGYLQHVATGAPIRQIGEPIGSVAAPFELIPELHELRLKSV